MHWPKIFTFKQSGQNGRSSRKNQDQEQSKRQMLENKELYFQESRTITTFVMWYFMTTGPFILIFKALN